MRVLLLVFVVLLAEPVVGLAAWWTRSSEDIITPHFAYQDPKSGEILHSSCNSIGSAAFSTLKPKVFPISDNIPFKSQPKFSTALAVAGWWDNDLNTPMASVFYQAVDNSIVKALFQCDNKTGYYTFDTNGKTVVSEIAGAPSVYKETGLAAVKLENPGEYQLHYHNEQRLVNLLSSTNERDWHYNGPVSLMPLDNTALASVHTGSTNISVVWPHGDDYGIAVANFKEDNEDKWSLDPPSSWASWLVNLSIAANLDSQLSVFYIGEDAQLHKYLQQTNGSWIEQASPGAKKWPKADDQFGRSAAASPPNVDEMWIYYESGNDVVELYRDRRGFWKDAQSTRLTTARNVDPDSGSNGNDDSPGTSSSSEAGETENLTRGAKIGIGIGASVGVLVIAIATWFLLRKRRQTTATTETQEPPELQDTGKVELSDTAKFELSDTAKFELSDTASRHSKTPRPSIERDESSQPDPKRRRSAGSRRAKTEETPSPAPHPIIPDEILVTPARDAMRGTEASTDDGIGEEIFGLSISPPLPWFAGMLSQYNKWVEQLPEVHRLEKYREETRSELDRLHVDQFRHEKVQVAFEPEYLGYHVREYREAYLTSQTKLRKAERKREIFQERLNHLEEQIGFKGGPRSHGTATADDGDFANGQLETEGGIWKWTWSNLLEG
ncbi:hypothetical protein FOXYS1_359 [Fusarium oxysporum]|uniref:Fucose-specific lectin n=1 Tax=Fusarium oxysporum TaxID=5507 RepID=A0A8H5EQ68_FUSOX|nr:hypothetical protein FOXYS1_359 [Fusarium oxysporum]